MTHVLRGSSPLVALELEAADGPVDSSTPVSVGAVRDDAGVVVVPGTATTKPANTTGRYELRLPLDATAEVDRLTLTWAVTVDGVAQTRVTTAEVVGGFYFPLGALRVRPGLGSPASFPSRDLARARARATDEIERDVGAAFVERFGRATLDGDGSPVAVFGRYLRRVLSVSTDGQPWSATDVAGLAVGPWGARAGRSFPAGRGNVVVRYVHSWSESPPVDVADAGLELARQHLLGWRSQAPDHPVDVAEMGELPAGNAERDRQGGQSQITRVISGWRSRLYGDAASVQLV